MNVNGAVLNRFHLCQKTADELRCGICAGWVRVYLTEKFFGLQKQQGAAVSTNDCAHFLDEG